MRARLDQRVEHVFTRAVLLALALSFAVVGLARPARAADGSLSVKITSPLGRTGTPGAVRIVARIDAPRGTILLPVRFFVDGALFKVDDDGPPYAVEWNDDDPFEARTLAVEAEDSQGHVARDEIALEPFQVQEKSEIFSTLIETTVRDKGGRYVRGLNAANFLVHEDGFAQKLDLVESEDVPATFVLMVDSSQSMSTRFEFVRRAASRLLTYLRSHDRVIVAPFTKQIGAITGPTDDRDTITAAIGAIHAAGGTAIFDGLTEITHRVGDIEGRRIIILITDGYDEHSQEGFNEALEAVKEAQVTVYPIGIGGVAGVSLRGEQQLKQLAQETGGRAYFPPRVEDLVDVYDRLATDAQNRYLITYTPTNQDQDGTWRKIKVQTGSPDDVILARTGYYAPQAPPVRPTIEFTVTDLAEQLVDVTRDDLVVREDGVEQQVDVFQEAVDPVQLVLTLDESGSMKKAAESVKDAAREFVTSLRPDDPLAVITFADKAQFAHDLATTRQWSYDAIDKYEALGGTALYDALYNSIMRLKFVKGRRAIVVLTDGRDENNPGTAPGSVHTLNEVLDRLHEVDVAIFAIGLGPKVDGALLQKLADLSGGRAYFPEDVSALGDQYRAIVENLHRRYVLSYNSTNVKRDGKWRNVQIVAKSGELQVKSRGGYFAPEK